MKVRGAVIIFFCVLGMALSCQMKKWQHSQFLCCKNGCAVKLAGALVWTEKSASVCVPTDMLPERQASCLSMAMVILGEVLYICWHV